MTVAVGMVLSSACWRGGPEGAVVLDGRARYPDAEGVLVAVTAKQLRLDGGPIYRVSPRLQAFSTYTLQGTPLLSRRNQYVQIGLQGRTVVWLAGIGAVVRAPGHPPTVYYSGKVKSAPAGRAVFVDGTVFRVAPGVAVPRKDTRVQVELDPASGRARAFKLLTS